MKAIQQAASTALAALLTAVLSLVLAPAARAAATGDKLFIATNGVALSQTPSANRLTATVTVGVTTPGTKARWTAAPGVSWLSVTSAGATGQPLTLTADPTGLLPDAVYVTNVIVRTTKTSAFRDQETIRVSLWTSATDPGTVSIAQVTKSLVANPVDPVVYVADNSPNIRAFHVHTGNLVQTYRNVAPTIGQMVSSSDGSALFAVDTTNYQIVELATRTGKVLRRFPLQGPVAADFSFAYARPAGNETLFAAGQSAINVATGAAVSAPITTAAGFYDPLITASVDGTRLAVIERGLVPGTLTTYAVTSASGRLTVAEVNSRVTIRGENCQAMAMTADGTRLYPACGWPNEFDVFDWSTCGQVQTLPTAPYPNNAVIDSLGDFVGGINGYHSLDDLFVFNRKGFLLGKVPPTEQGYVDGQSTHMLATSGDSTRVISATGPQANPQYLMFRDLP